MNTELVGPQWFEPTKQIGDEIIICGGDSFTKYSVYHSLGIKTWTEQLAEHFGRKVVVVGQPGAGNKLIQQRVTEQLLTHNKIHSVFVMWTTLFRSSWKISPSMYENIRPISTYSEAQLERIEMDSFKTIFSKLIDVNHQHQLVDESLHSFYNLQEQLRARNIPYGFHWYRNDNTDMKVIKEFLAHPVYNHIQESAFKGWPLFKEIGGEGLVSEKNAFGSSSSPDLRNHPNQIGHDMYAKSIIQHFEKEVLKQ